MRVLIISTFEKNGGAAVAASRLGAALNANGVKARMLVRDKSSDHPWVIPLDKSPRLKLRFIWERVCIWIENKFRKENLFAVSLANTGEDVTRLEDFRKADVIHLHWVNQGMLSLKDIQKIVESGKPVIWTMHDMWNMTGICHYTSECEHYRTKKCLDCPMLPGITAIAHKIFKRKEKLYQHARIAFVGCSQWLAKKGKESVLLGNCQVESIPNPINTVLFAPQPQQQIRIKRQLPCDKKLLLFGSMKVTDKRKGFDYLLQACCLLAEQYPSLKEELGIVMMGGQADEVVNQLPFPVYCMGFLNNEKDIAEVYNTADLYVTPALEENLPNTIMEALSCGIPAVGFEVGGIPEMIDHRQNGYVAHYKSAEDLAAGIFWSLYTANHSELKKNAREKVIKNYSEEVVARQYIELYQSKRKK